MSHSDLDAVRPIPDRTLVGGKRGSRSDSRIMSKLRLVPLSRVSFRLASGLSVALWADLSTPNSSSLEVSALTDVERSPETRLIGLAPTLLPLLPHNSESMKGLSAIPCEVCRLARFDLCVISAAR